MEFFGLNESQFTNIIKNKIQLFKNKLISLIKENQIETLQDLLELIKDNINNIDISIQDIPQELNSAIDPVVRDFINNLSNIINKNLSNIKPINNSPNS